MTFEGFGFKAGGEVIYFWNSAAKSDLDTVAAASFLSSFAGISLQADELESIVTAILGAVTSLIVDSRLGEHRAFYATTTGDLGSPGYTSNSPLPQFTHVNNSLAGVTLHWRARAEKHLCAEIQADVE